jgi:excisionase family DNA binding protein
MVAGNLCKSARGLSDTAIVHDNGVMEHDTQTGPRLGLSISEAARMLGVSLSTVRRWSDSGVLPSYRTPGGQRRYNREQLEGFLRSLQRGA